MSRADLQRIVGGVVGDPGGGGPSDDGGTGVGDCSASATCTGCKKASCNGKTACTAKDDDGVSCDGVKTACKKYPDPGCI